MITHIFKDGTVKTDLKDVCVPKEIVEQVVSIAKRKTEGRRENNGN